MKKYDKDKINSEDLKKAVGTIFMIASDYMFYPGHIENWVVIVDTDDRPFHDVPLSVKKN